MNEENVACKAAADTIKVIKYLPGDVNGSVDGRDLLRLARFLGGYDVEINRVSSDVTGDGQVDGRDLLRFARYLGGYDVVLQ